MRKVASVTTDCLTSDIGRFIRSKKGSQGGKVAGFSQPWRDDVPLYGFGENRQAFHRFSHDHPGRYGVTPDTLTPMLNGNVFGQGYHRPFGSAVGNSDDIASHPGIRGGIDDRRSGRAHV